MLLVCYGLQKLDVMQDVHDRLDVYGDFVRCSTFFFSRIA